MITLPYDGYGEIGEIGDIDWYRFTLSEPATLYIETYSLSFFGQPVGETKIFLVSEPNCTPNESCDNSLHSCDQLQPDSEHACHVQGRGSSNDYSFFDGQTVQPGTYYVVVNGE